MNLERSRENNLDLLRAICVIAVIIIHVSTFYKYEYTEMDNPNSLDVLITSIFNVVTRFAVPCFLMLSGAFLLANKNNKDYKKFYSKSFKKIGIPMIIFSFIYLILRTILNYYLGIDNGILNSFIDAFIDFLLGEPFYHMWYLYTLVGIYLLIPFLIKLKDDIGEKPFAIVSYVYLLVATISAYLNTSVPLMWGLSHMPPYIGYVLVGYQIRRHSPNKNGLKGALCILASLCLLFALSLYQYDHTMKGVLESKERYTIVGGFNPIVVLSSLLIFKGFSLLSVKENKFITALDNDSLLIYLFHAGIWEILNLVVLSFVDELINPLIYIPIATAIVLAISWILTLLFKKIWSLIDKDSRVSNKLASLIKL